MFHPRFGVKINLPKSPLCNCFCEGFNLKVTCTPLSLSMAKLRKGPGRSSHHYLTQVVSPNKAGQARSHIIKRGTLDLSPFVNSLSNKWFPSKCPLPPTLPPPPPPPHVSAVVFWMWVRTKHLMRETCLPVCVCVCVCVCACLQGWVCVLGGGGGGLHACTQLCVSIYMLCVCVRACLQGWVCVLGGGGGGCMPARSCACLSTCSVCVCVRVYRGGYVCWGGGGGCMPARSCACLSTCSVCVCVHACICVCLHKQNKAQINKQNIYQEGGRCPIHKLYKVVFAKLQITH